MLALGGFEKSLRLTKATAVSAGRVSSTMRPSFCPARWVRGELRGGSADDRHDLGSAGAAAGSVTTVVPPAPLRAPSRPWFRPTPVSDDRDRQNKFMPCRCNRLHR